MNANWKPPDPGQLLWPVAALVLGALAATNPFYEPHITLKIGIVAWFIDTALVLIFSLRPTTSHVAVLVGGLFMAVPCFLQASPLLRFLLMCWMALPFAIVALQLFAAPSAGFRERWAIVFTWLGTQEVKRRPRSFEAGSLLQLTIATVVFAVALAAVKSIPPFGAWLPVRWFAAGIMMLSFAEMATSSHYFVTALLGINAPALMKSPHLSVSVREFWAERWNPATSVLAFRKYFYAPLARRGAGLALFLTFFASAVAHLLLAQVATEKWTISLMWGVFFLLQPLLIAVERWMKVRRWRPAAARAWTLTGLAVTSPLFIEPALRIVGPSWGTPDNLLLPTLTVLGFVILVNLLFAVFAFIQPKQDNAERRAALRDDPTLQLSSLGVTDELPP